VGDVKILCNPKTGKYRVLMRRDVVHKIACNFMLKPEMELNPMGAAANSWIFVAMDYDEEEGYKTEKFAIKFKVRYIVDVSP
jgi:E3 SUMO-protein ligase RanBP2